MTLLLAFTGTARSGKTTAARLVTEWCEANGLSCRSRGFADAVKWSAARVFHPNITEEEAIEWADMVKFNHIIEAWDDKTAEHLCSVETGVAAWVPAGSVTGRQFLQHYGTEAHRDIFGKDFWVQHLLPISDRNHFAWQEAWGSPDVAIVHDLRFDNEAKRVEILDGYIFKMSRGSDRGDAHESEAGIDPYYTRQLIDNNGPLIYLEGEINKIMMNFVVQGEIG